MTASNETTGVSRRFLREDWHVHSTFSDGEGSLEQNADAARRRGLHHLGCVDHVRSSSRWVPEYVEAVRALREQLDPRFTVTAGVEAKLLDCDGTLDLPPRKDREGVDLIVIADHAVPTPSGPMKPADVAAAIKGGALAAHEAASWVVSSTVAAMRRHHGAQVAHLFSVLPKAGMSPADVPEPALVDLIDTAREARCSVEINERWQTPSAAIATAFARSGVRLVASTDAHSPAGVGVYQHVAGAFSRLGKTADALAQRTAGPVG